MRPEPAFRRLPRAVREQQILDAAVTVFSRHGYHSASVDEIAESAGISKPMVYAYLGSKEELFIACLHRESTRLMEAIVDTVTTSPSAEPDQQIWRGLRAFFAFVSGHRDGWLVLFRQARAQQPFADELVTIHARMADVVTAMLGKIIADNGLEPVESEVKIIGYALVGAAEAVADWLVDHPTEEPEVTATRLMGVIWPGAAAALRGERWRAPVSP